MTREQYEQIKAIFHATLECETGRRSDFLDQACAGDEKLRRKVEALLASHEQAGRFMDVPALEVVAEEFAKMKYCPQCNKRYFGDEKFCQAHPPPRLSSPDVYDLVNYTDSKGYGIVGDKYRIYAHVATGGFGAVYYAEHTELERIVAYKILKPDRGAEKLKVSERFKREARTLAALNHPGIPEVYGVGEISVLDPESREMVSTLYIEMAWVEGATLEKELKSATARFDTDRIKNILMGIADALQAAHDKGIIHCDLKPSNILLVKEQNGSEQVKIVDFGISRIVDETGQASNTTALGTKEYASLEQFNEGGEIDRRADIYALGVILYEMLAGKLPFEGSSVEELLQNKRNKQPQRLSDLRSDVTLDVEKLVDSMLAKDPNQRPQRVGDIPALFEQALSDRNESRPWWHFLAFCLGVSLILVVVVLGIAVVPSLLQGNGPNGGTPTPTPAPTPTSTPEPTPSAVPSPKPSPTASRKPPENKSASSYYLTECKRPGHWRKQAAETRHFRGVFHFFCQVL